MNHFVETMTSGEFSTVDSNLYRTLTGCKFVDQSDEVIRHLSSIAPNHVLVRDHQRVGYFHLID
jgi:hypothetical protein